jgi:hypothetical protein
MHPNRPLIASAYLVALSFLLLPLAQSVLGAWPLRVGEPSWRFGAAGIASNSVLTVLLGLVLLTALALLLNHRRVLRVLAAASVLACLSLFLATGELALDAVQLHARVQPQMQLGFLVAVVQLFAKLALAMLCSALVGAGAWKASRRPVPERTRPRRDPAAGLLAHPGALQTGS